MFSCRPWLASAQFCFNASMLGALPALMETECLHACDATVTIEPALCDCVGAADNTRQR
jgi:hypothetical protein